MGDVTRLLRKWNEGNQDALEELTRLVYPELRRIARRRMARERPGHTLQTTGLIHETYIRLIDQRVDWSNREQFFHVAARIMRRVLVDHARGRSALKRGGPEPDLPLEHARWVVDSSGVDLVALDDALWSLERIHPRQSRIVELKFFAGMTIDEIAEVTQTSPASVKRCWETAKMWLRRRMR